MKEHHGQLHHIFMHKEKLSNAYVFDYSTRNADLFSFDTVVIFPTRVRFHYNIFRISLT